MIRSLRDESPEGVGANGHTWKFAFVRRMLKTLRRGGISSFTKYLAAVNAQCTTPCTHPAGVGKPCTSQQVSNSIVLHQDTSRGAYHGVAQGGTRKCV